MMGGAMFRQRLHTEAAVTPQPRIAALSMYDLPELQAANDALWSAIAIRLEHYGVCNVPFGLSRDADFESCWRSPHLLLAQACGYPLITALAGCVRLVATPRYQAPGCEGPFRRSALVVSASSSARDLASLRGSRCAINDLRSASAMNLLRAAVAPIAAGASFFQDVAITGSHLTSAEAVASDSADLAALDAVTLAHLRRFRPALTKQLRVLVWTERTPGLPLITSSATDQATHRALLSALDDVASDAALADVRETLRLDGFNALPLSQYCATLHLEERARQYGYQTVR